MAVTDELSSILGNEMGQNAMSVLAGIQKGVGNVTVAFANLTKGIANGTAEFQKMAHTLLWHPRRAGSRRSRTWSVIGAATPAYNGDNACHLRRRSEVLPQQLKISGLCG